MWGSDGKGNLWVCLLFYLKQCLQEFSGFSFAPLARQIVGIAAFLIHGFDVRPCVDQKLNCLYSTTKSGVEKRSPSSGAFSYDGGSGIQQSADDRRLIAFRGGMQRCGLMEATCDIDLRSSFDQQFHEVQTVVARARVTQDDAFLCIKICTSMKQMRHGLGISVLGCG